MPNDAPDWQAATDVSIVTLGTVIMAANATTASLNVTPDATTVGLLLQVRTLTQPPTVSVVGGVSGTNYTTYPLGAGTGHLFWVACGGQLDSPFTITVTTPAPLSAVSATPCVDVGGMRGSGLQIVKQSPQDIWSVGLYTVSGSLNPANAVPVRAPAGFATAKGMEVATLNNGATANVIAGVAGQVITLYAWSWHVNMSANGLTVVTLETDPAGVAFDVNEVLVPIANATAHGPAHSIAVGQSPVALPAGQGIRVHNLGNNVVDVSGSIVYTQA